jgi:hypothetical protein
MVFPLLAALPAALSSMAAAVPAAATAAAPAVFTATPAMLSAGAAGIGAGSGLAAGLGSTLAGVGMKALPQALSMMMSGVGGAPTRQNVTTQQGPGMGGGQPMGPAPFQQQGGAPPLGMLPMILAAMQQGGRRD